jgi:F0F1-type ATP synthase assembly protein I
VRKGFVIACVMVLVLFGLSIAVEKPATKFNEVVVSKAVVKPGETVAIAVNLVNSDTLAGAQVPIFYRSETIKLICDSVSFAGGLTEKFQFHDIKIPLICEKCETRYINPTKIPGICDNEKCGGKLVNKDQVVFFSVINITDPSKEIAPMYPGKGLLATIYFTAPKDSPKGVVKLVRGMIPDKAVDYTFSVWNTTGVDQECKFVDGAIEVK